MDDVNLKSQVSDASPVYLSKNQCLALAVAILSAVADWWLGQETGHSTKAQQLTENGITGIWRTTCPRQNLAVNPLYLEMGS